MTKEPRQIVFHIKILMPKGAMYVMYFRQLEATQRELVNGMLDGRGIKLTINQVHDKLGHIGEDAVRKIAEHLGWQLARGTITACESCAVGKAKQQNLGHRSEVLVPTVRVHVHLDILSIKKPESISRVYKPHLQIIVVEAMQLKFVHFFATKDSTVELTCELLSRWKKSGRGVDIMRLDNAGENALLQN